MKAGEDYVEALEKALVSYGSFEHFTNSQAGLKAQAALAALEDK